MQAIDVLDRKRSGLELGDEEIRFLIEGIESGRVADYQASAFLMAVCIRGMTERETFSLTRAMLSSGVELDFSQVSSAVVDKHSTGGVGDKTSIAVAPLVAACGAFVPMITGRGLGHTGGTLDKLEAIPGFDASLSEERFHDVVAEYGFAIIGQTDRIAPADRRLYALRDATATVLSLPLITASILSKKLAEGICALVMDVKCGSGAFMATIVEAERLAKLILSMAERFDTRASALITNMDQPLGRTVGNAVEVAEAIQVLKGEAESDLTELSVELAAQMLRSSGVEPNEDAARRRIREAIASGAGAEKLGRVIEAQGGDPGVVEDAGRLPRSREERVIEAEDAGFVGAIDTRGVGRAAMLLGAGRERASDGVDPAAGLLVEAKLGAKLERGAPLARLLYNDSTGVEEAEALVRSSYRVEEEPPTEPNVLVHTTLTSERTD